MATLTAIGTQGRVFGTGGVGFGVADSYQPHGPYPYAANLISAAGITSTAQRTALSSFTDGLLNLGLLHPTAPVLSRLKALWPMLGGTANAHALNLLDARPAAIAHALAYRGGVSHSATGIRFDGSSGFADTNLELFTEVAPTNMTIGAYLRDDQSSRGGYGVDFGIIQGGNYTSLNVNTGGMTYFGAFSGETGTSRPTTKGLWLLRNNGQVGQCWLNGSLLKETTNLRQGPAPINMGLGACYYNLGPPDLFAANEHALAFAGEALAPGEIGTFTALVQAYQNALNRQV